MQQEAVSAINAMVVTNLTETESSCELVRSLPCDTRLEGHCISILGSIKQSDVTTKIYEQGEFVTNGATHITNIRLEIQSVGGNGCQFGFCLVKTIVNSKSYLPLVVDCIAHFRSNVKSHVVLFHLST